MSIRRKGFTLVELLVVIAIIGMLIALLLPAVQAAREAARRTQCTNNLKQIGLGMHNYADAHRGLPPQRTFTGSPWYSSTVHGWGVDVLPFMEQQSLHDLYQLDKPFFDPVNQPVVSQRLPVYECPSAPTSHLVDALPVPPSYATDPNLHGAVGDYASLYGRYDPVRYPSEPYKDGALVRNRILPFAEILDGTSNTFLIVERAGRPEWWVKGRKQDGVPDDAFSSFNWVGPWASYNSFWARGYSHDGLASFGECAANCNNELGLYAFHPGGVNVLLADGSVRLLQENVSLLNFYALITRNGGEVVSLP